MFGVPVFILTLLQYISITYQRLKRTILKLLRLESKRSRASVDPIFISEYLSMPRPLSEYCQPSAVSFHSAPGSFASMNSVNLTIPPPTPLPRLSIDSTYHNLPYLGPPAYYNKY